jgi:hypothetical protein
VRDRPRTIGISSVNLERMSSRCFWLIALWALAGCALEPAKAGEKCRRSTECQDGLACVRERCSRDLGPIADESTVPEIGGSGDEASLPAADGG